MLNITNQHRNTNQNYNEMPPHQCNGYYQIKHLPPRPEKTSVGEDV